MIIRDKILIIIQYITLFTKKKYRLDVEKKIRYMEDEFPYLKSEICVFFSKSFSIIENFFYCIIPFTVLLYPIFYKYIILIIFLSLFIFKMKDVPIKKFNKFLFHKIFIKNAVFEFIGITLIGLNLIILFDFKIFILIGLLFIIPFLITNKFKTILIYIYPIIYVVILSIINRDINGSLFYIGVFILLILSLYFYSKYIISYRIKETKENKNVYLFYLNIKRFIRKLTEKRTLLITYIFPPHLILFTLVYTVTINYFFSSINNQPFTLLVFVIYFFVFLLITKMKAFLYDDCFYFTATKIELYKSNLINNYLQRIITNIFVHIFNIFWGMFFLHIVLKVSWNIQVICALIFIHIFILIISLSADVYIDKNKYEITKYPVDIRKYLSLIEGFFLSSTFILSYIFIMLMFNKQTEKIKYLFSFDFAITSLTIITFITGTVSILKILNHIWMTNKYLKGGENK